MDKLDFNKMNGLIPCIVQDDQTDKVLMLGFMNQEAFNKTRETGKVTFFSRSKQTLWTKGETSGNYLEVKTILSDCDSDTILIKAKPQGPICHTGADTCFNETNRGWNLSNLETIIENRKTNPTDQSYTSELFGKGIYKIAQKVGEEAVELVIEAGQKNDEAFLNEAADLLFHFLVLLQARHKTLDDVVSVLRNRHRA